jgi:hypothetical protein
MWWVLASSGQLSGVVNSVGDYVSDKIVQLGAVSDFVRLAGTMGAITRTDTKPRG